MNLKIIIKVFMVLILSLIAIKSGYSQIKIAEISDLQVEKEGSKRTVLRNKSREMSSGYVNTTYNQYDREMDQIFSQLEVITGDEETRYIVVPGDTLTITYTDKDELIGAVYQVSGEGEINVPLIGVVKVNGLNRKQVREKLNELYGSYFRYPNVTLTVNASGRFMVVGSVMQPGVYYMQSNLTVMEAILNAGSYLKDEANMGSVMLMRGGLNTPEVRRLNLKKMLSKGDRRDNLIIKPGDLIYVPKTFISNLEKFKDTVYRYVSAYYGYGRLPAPPDVEPRQPILWDR